MPTSSPWHATKTQAHGLKVAWCCKLSKFNPRCTTTVRRACMSSTKESPGFKDSNCPLMWWFTWHSTCLSPLRSLPSLPSTQLYVQYIYYVCIYKYIYIYYQSICSLSWTCWSVKREWKSIGSLCWCVTISGGFLRWTVSSWLFVVIPRNLPFTDPWRVLASAWLCPVEGTWCILPVEWSRNKKLLGAKGIATRKQGRYSGLLALLLGTKKATSPSVVPCHRFTSWRASSSIWFANMRNSEQFSLLSHLLFPPYLS